MRVPLKTEGDAFRMAVALGLVAGAALLVGWLAAAKYGIVLFAAGVAAGVVFELAGRGAARGAWSEAAYGPHRDAASGGERHVLVVASAALAGEALRQALSGVGAAAVKLDVLAPILASRAHYWASDVDRERAEARERLARSLAWAAEHGFDARGEIGDADALLAIEDELRDFGADEVIVTTHAGERRSWLADRMLAQLGRELDVPVREIAVTDDPSSIAPGAP